MDLQQVAKSRTERSHEPFVQYGLMMTSYITVVQNQEADIATTHRPYSDFSCSYLLRVCSFSGLERNLDAPHFSDEKNEKKGQRG